VPNSFGMRVLLVEDDADIAAPLVRGLEREGFLVTHSETGVGALAASDGPDAPDVVLLDLGLPDLDGFEVCRRMRSGSEVPIIVVTARGDEVDRVVGLELGADDYVVKPFSPRELVARVRSVLRRVATAAPPSAFEFGNLRVDTLTRDVTLDGAPVELRRREFDLLAFLCAAPRQVFSREQLLVNVWNSAPDWQDTATVSEHVHRLRAKIEVDPARPQRIVTVRGVGYRFEP